MSPESAVLAVTAADEKSARILSLDISFAIDAPIVTRASMYCDTHDGHFGSHPTRAQGIICCQGLWTWI
jgi:hypothetical protein